MLETSANKTYCIHDICALPRYYAPNSGNLLQTFPENPSLTSSLTTVDGTYRSFRNVGNELPPLAA